MTATTRLRVANRRRLRARMVERHAARLPLGTIVLALATAWVCWIVGAALLMAWADASVWWAP